VKKEENKKLASASAIVRAYWGEVAKHPYYFLGVISSTLGLLATSLVSPLFMKQFFNELQSRPQSSLTEALFVTLFFIALTWGFDWVFTQLQRSAIQGLESRVMERLYAKSFDYLMRHSYNFFVNNFAGSLVHKTGRYARSFEILFDTISQQFLPTLLFIIGATFILFLQNHILGIILAVWDVLFIVLQIYLSRLRQPVRNVRAAADTKLTGAISDSISNQSTVSLFAAHGYELKQFSNTVSEWRKATIRSWSSDQWVQGGLSLFMTAIQVVIMYVAILFWSKDLLTLGDFYLIQAYLLGTFNRLIGINYSLRRFYDAYTDASEMVAILETPHEITEKPKAKKLTVEKGSIEFKKVYFRFNLETEILRDFNLHIAGGQKVALVGPSGAGKSTITKLLLRMYDVTSGAIDIDSQEIANVTQDSLRRAISFVPQEPVLFHRSLIENIRYGRHNATDAEVMDAAKKANCHDFIAALPLGYETLVGERGIKLSGGERQRVAIARAILKNAPILVLDEATSSLDSQSELLIQQALDVLMQGKTVLVIAHRLSTIMKMDRIVVLEHGKIVADGTHSELLSQGGLYAHLWNIQAGGFLLEDEKEDVELPDGEEILQNDTNLET
jgi:ATP-binding cassette subfamily B protein